MQRLFALRQDLAETALADEYRESLQCELLAIITELRNLAGELRLGVSAHDRPPPDLGQLLSAVSAALRDRPALESVATEHANLQPASGTAAPDASRPQKRLLLQLDDETLVRALRTADGPLG